MAHCLSAVVSLPVRGRVWNEQPVTKVAGLRGCTGCSPQKLARSGVPLPRSRAGACAQPERGTGCLMMSLPCTAWSVGFGSSSRLHQ